MTSFQGGLRDVSVAQPEFRSDPALHLLLEEAVPSGVERYVDLTPFVRWKVGGPAFALVTPSSEAETAAVLRLMSKRPEPLFVMGDASNLLFDTRGFDGVVMRIGRELSRTKIVDNRIYAQSGVWVPYLAHRAANAGLSGLEHTIGIPGTLGGLVLMNGGSQRKGIGLNILRVDCLDNDGASFSLDQEECGFSYRRSALQGRNAVVVGAELELVPGDRRTILREMIDIMISRKSTKDCIMLLCWGCWFICRILTGSKVTGKQV